MHAFFIPYGRKLWVDLFLNELQALKLPMRFYKEGEPEMFLYIDCQLRVLPGGIMDFVFPKEHMDIVLTGLGFNKPVGKNYRLDKEFSIFGFTIKPLEYFKKYLEIDDIPKFKTDKRIILTDMFVSVIPLGIKQDLDFTEPQGESAGWTHEAI